MQLPSFALGKFIHVLGTMQNGVYLLVYQCAALSLVKLTVLSVLTIIQVALQKPYVSVQIQEEKKKFSLKSQNKALKQASVNYFKLIPC